ncbi:hypothetical protein FKM82_004992 [Ascaphus truei]
MFYTPSICSINPQVNIYLMLFTLCTGEPFLKWIGAIAFVLTLYFLLNPVSDMFLCSNNISLACAYLVELPSCQCRIQLLDRAVNMDLIFLNWVVVNTGIPRINVRNGTEACM